MNLALPVFALLLLAPSAGLPLQNSDERVALADLTVFHALIDHYRAGDDGSVRDLASWDQDRIKRIHVLLGRLSDPRPWDRARFEAAVMLHTDAALFILKASASQRVGLETVLFHLRVADLLLKLASARWRISAFASGWYVAVARVLRERNWLAAADRHLGFGRERLPNDAAVLYESATLSELLATATQLPGPPSGVLTGETPVARQDSWSPVGIAVLRRSHAAHLNQAASWLRQSLERSPDQPMARLHLGRVQTLRKEDADAERQLIEATRTADAAIGYLAWLFTGALDERQQRLEPALDAYRRATERFPLGQAACIAQSALLARLGRGSESAAILQALLAADPDRRHDPWRQYFFDPPGRADARLDAIRRQVRQ